MDGLLKGVAAFRADKVTPHTGSCSAKAMLVVCALTLVAKDQWSASRATVAYFTVIVSDPPPETDED